MSRAAALRRGLGRALRLVAVAPIVAYRRILSPLKPVPTCRFHPTCSAYAHDAILRHGIVRGGWLSLRRVAKCHPWHPGGLDPVPPAPAVPRIPRAAHGPGRPHEPTPSPALDARPPGGTA